MYGLLNHKLGEANFSDAKTPRETERQNWMSKNNEYNGGLSLVNAYKKI